MGKPILYGPTYSTYTRSMRMVLAEKGVDYELVDVDMIGGAHHRPDWIQRHPFERVPAFEHNGFAIYETNAIAHYIDDAFPGRRLAHPHIHRRTRDQQIVEVINAYGYKRIIGDIVLRYSFADETKGSDTAAIATAAPAAEHALNAIQNLMLGSDPYLVGRDVSFSDLFLAPIIGYFMQFPEGTRAMTKLSRLSNWWLAMQQRPSFMATAPKM
ncbi:glutathione S-transferase family protein [Dongia deserti]|uniref:glutathione S-transferase family protein n=1 Tax=Dongia deserti TaxID=2268030 RepID=UPI000E6513E1|nr:glutathione S-transferase family protein [Dongia deserti]